MRLRVPPALAVAALATAFAGAGTYSLDHVLGWSLGGEECALGAVVGALALGLVALASRSVRLPQRRGRRRAAA